MTISRSSALGKVDKKSQNPRRARRGLGRQAPHMQALSAVKVKRCGMCTHISHGLTLTGRTSHGHFAYARSASCWMDRQLESPPTAGTGGVVNCMDAMN